MRLSPELVGLAVIDSDGAVLPAEGDVTIKFQNLRKEEKDEISVCSHLKTTNAGRTFL